MAPAVLTSDNDTGLVAVFLAGDSRVDRNYDPSEIRNLIGLDASSVNVGPAPQRALQVLQQLAFKLLTTQPGALISRSHFLKRGSGEVLSVLPGGSTGDVDSTVTTLIQFLDQLRGPWGSGHHDTGMLTNTEGRYQALVPGFRIAPRTEFVTPGTGEVRTTKSLRLVSTESIDDAAVDEVEAQFVPSPLILNPWLQGLADARWTLETGSSHVTEGGSDHSPHATGLGQSLLDNPVGSDPGLAPASTTHDEVDVVAFVYTLASAHSAIGVGQMMSGISRRELLRPSEAAPLQRVVFPLRVQFRLELPNQLLLGLLGKVAPIHPLEVAP